MFSKSIIALLLGAMAGSSSYAAAANNPDSALISHVHRQLQVNAGHLRRELGIIGNADDFDICQLVQLHLGDDFIAGSAKGSCDCQGDLTGTIELSCSFDQICDDFDLFCADVQLNATFGGLFNENGGFGTDPQMNIDACVDTTVEYLEPMCLGLRFAKPDFFLPDDCSFSYGGKDCICEIDNSVPCYNFNCSAVVPEPLADIIASDTCKKVDMTEGGNVMMFLPALADLPEETPVFGEEFLAEMAAAGESHEQQKAEVLDTMDEARSGSIRFALWKPLAIVAACSALVLRF